MLSVFHSFWCACGCVAVCVDGGCICGEGACRCGWVRVTSDYVSMSNYHIYVLLVLFILFECFFLLKSIPNGFMHVCCIRNLRNLHDRIRYNSDIFMLYLGMKPPDIYNDSCTFFIVCHVYIYSVYIW